MINFSVQKCVCASVFYKSVQFERTLNVGYDSIATGVVLALVIGSFSCSKL